MTTDKPQNQEKRGQGRPKGTTKPDTGKNLWIPAELLETVQVLIQAQRQKQAKQ